MHWSEKNKHELCSYGAYSLSKVCVCVCVCNLNNLINYYKIISTLKKSAWCSENLKQSKEVTLELREEVWGEIG